MDIDYHLLKPETLQAVIEEFILREGTDYGEREATFETKAAQVLRLLDQGKIKLIFDPETESCDLREVPGKAQPAGKAHHPSLTARNSKKD